ncbi:MBL fold metallo-hydrolase [Phytohalomonas tamaricis]|uniref:MBL fold metallo-hydrolase n=1 Tax=Phytohalomonas tamaricis TaxID=2081032 RepID=UPI000D0AC118|nr:MBL fold metallo-hydrolase [Phytohalomonas tamaricis]
MRRSWLLLLLLTVLVTSPARAEPQYQIEQMKDNVYRLTAGHYRSVFMVTDAGIFLTDPINDNAAAWLRDELDQRFSDTPIRYVAYSHNHFDHTYGGQEFAAEGVTFISHRLAREDLVRTRAETQIPDLVFDDTMSVYLGDSEVRMHYHGTNNGRGSVSMTFEPAGVLYVVDWIVLGRMPYKDLKGYDIHGMIDSTREVLNMDFDLLVGGHANAGTREDVEHYLGYLEALYAAVRDGMLQGKSLETLQEEIHLDDYSDLAIYEEWLPLNIAGVYRTLNDSSYMDMRSDLES